MASYDLVSRIDMSEMKNVVIQTKKQISGRYDFKGSKITLEYKNDEIIEVVAEDDYKLKACLDILRTNMAKRNIGMNCLDVAEAKASGNQMVKQIMTLKQGVDKESGKKINKLIKSSGMKVTSQYMDEKIRVTGKKIDDLRAIYAFLKQSKDLNMELQMENMKG